MPHDMMMNTEDGSCSEPINKAIELHQQHMDDPSSATPKSQEQLMDLLKEHQSMMGEGDEGETGDMMKPDESTPYNRDNMMAMLMKRKAMKPER